MSEEVPSEAMDAEFTTRVTQSAESTPTGANNVIGGDDISHLIGQNNAGHLIGQNTAGYLIGQNNGGHLIGQNNGGHLIGPNDEAMTDNDETMIGQKSEAEAASMDVAKEGQSMIGQTSKDIANATDRASFLPSTPRFGDASAAHQMSTIPSEDHEALPTCPSLPPHQAPQLSHPASPQLLHPDGPLLQQASTVQQPSLAGPSLPQNDAQTFIPYSLGDESKGKASEFVNEGK